MLNYEIAKFSLNEIHMYNKNIFINMQLLIFVHVYYRQFMVEKKMCHWKKFTYRERNNLKECIKILLACKSRNIFYK